MQIDDDIDNNFLNDNDMKETETSNDYPSNILTISDLKIKLTNLFKAMAKFCHNVRKSRSNMFKYESNDTHLIQYTRVELYKTEWQDILDNKVVNPDDNKTYDSISMFIYQYGEYKFDYNSIYQELFSSLYDVFDLRRMWECHEEIKKIKLNVNKRFKNIDYDAPSSNENSFDRLALVIAEIDGINTEILNSVNKVLDILYN